MTDLLYEQETFLFRGRCIRPGGSAHENRKDMLCRPFGPWIGISAFFFRGLTTPAEVVSALWALTDTEQNAPRRKIDLPLQINNLE